MIVERWQNAHGSCSVTVEVVAGQHQGVKIPVPDGEYSLIIEFTSTGFYDSGSYWYPPEANDERSLENAYFEDIEVVLPIDVQEELFYKFEKDVYAAEIERDYYDGDY